MEDAKMLSKNVLSHEISTTIMDVNAPVLRKSITTLEAEGGDRTVW